MMQYDSYIFDLDGTLLYTLDDLTNSVNHAMRELCWKEHTTDDVRKMVGDGVRKLVERAVPDGKSNPLYEEAYNLFINHYVEHNEDTTRPYEGIIETLDTLKRRGCKIAVVSNKFCEATEELCKHFFCDYIDVAIGESKNVRKKPAPDSVIEAMRRIGADKERSVYIGDSEVDIETAKNSGLPCISVLWGFRNKEFLIKHGATTFISHPTDLLK